MPNYTIAGTDYDNYSIVYSCSPFYGGGFEMLWILARERELSDDMMSKIIDEIHDKIPSYDFDRKAHYTHQGHKCPDEGTRPK